MQNFENPIDIAQIGQIRIGNQNRTVFKFDDCNLNMNLKILHTIFVVCLMFQYKYNLNRYKIKVT